MPIGQLPLSNVPTVASIVQQGPLSGQMQGLQIGQQEQQNTAALLAQQLQNTQMQYQTDQMLKNAGLDQATRDLKTSQAQFDTDDIQSGAALARKKIADVTQVLKASSLDLDNKSQQMLQGGQAASTIQNYLSGGQTDAQGNPVTPGSTDPYKIKAARDLWQQAGTLPKASDDDAAFLDQVDQYAGWNRNTAPMILQQAKAKAESENTAQQGRNQLAVQDSKAAVAEQVADIRAQAQVAAAQARQSAGSAAKAMLQAQIAPGFVKPPGWDQSLQAQIALAGLTTPMSAGATVGSLSNPSAVPPLQNAQTAAQAASNATGAAPAVAQPDPAAQATQGLPKVTDQKSYDAVPEGGQYVAPDGSIKIKTKKKS